jgi:glycine C-acetyltransferase
MLLQNISAAAQWCARMMSGHTKYHEQLEQEFIAFVMKRSGLFVEFYYQGMVSGY